MYGLVIGKFTFDWYTCMISDLSLHDQHIADYYATVLLMFKHVHTLTKVIVNSHVHPTKSLNNKINSSLSQCTHTHKNDECGFDWLRKCISSKNGVKN